MPLSSDGRFVLDVARRSGLPLEWKETDGLHLFCAVKLVGLAASRRDPVIKILPGGAHTGKGKSTKGHKAGQAARSQDLKAVY